MTGFRNTLKKLFYSEQSSERGTALVEFAFVVPVLVMLAFSGYNMMRRMEVDMLKKDLARSLALSYLCSFESTAATAVCYNDAVNQIATYEASKQVLKNSNANIKFYYSVSTYRLTNPDVTERTVTACNGYTGTMPIEYIGGYTSPNYTEAYYDFNSVSTRAGGANKMLMYHLFNTNRMDTIYGRTQFCINGIVTVAEVKFELTPFFNYGGTEPQAFYEISYI